MANEEPESEQTPEAEEKKPRVYKGVVVKANALDLGRGPVVVQTLPDQRKAMGLPLFMVIERVDENMGLQYRDPRDGMRQKNALVMKGKEIRALEVNVLQGRMGDELRAEVAQWKANRPLNAQYPGHSTGADPEMFVVDEKGVLIPAFTFLPHKDEPLKTGTGNTPGTLYWDGFQGEFTVQATGCLGYVADSIAYGLIGLHEAAKRHNPKARLSIDSVLPVPDGILEEAKDEHVEFGCAPSLNAYGLEGNKLPGRQVPLRFAGGHILFGTGVINEGNKRNAMRGIKALDAILGVSCVSLFEGYDNPARRAFYGLPGEYRLPKHGIEYRSLSNAWLVHPTIMYMVIDLGRRALGYGWHDSSGWVAEEEEVVACMRDNDIALARKILDRNKTVFKAVMRHGFYEGTQGTLFKVFMGGMGEVLKNPRDVDANWGLSKGVAGWVTHCEGHQMNWNRSKYALQDGVKI